MRPVPRFHFRTLASMFVLAGLLVVPSAGRAAAGGATPWPLGTMKVRNAIVGDCPAGFSCAKFIVQNCPLVDMDDHGQLAWSAPATSPRGVVIFFDGGGGNEWWADPGPGEDFLAHLRDDDHFIIVENRWVSIGWLDALEGDQIGAAHLACRPATLIQWVHDHIYAPLHLDPLPGQCGFCITGNSGGASQVAFPLPFYGLDTILDADIPTGGPDHAAITKACLQVPGYEYNDTHRKTMDYSYGYQNPESEPGPCLQSDPTWAARWDADSVELGGNDYSYPTTRVELIEGGLDDTGAPAHAADFRDVLEQDPNNSVTWTFIPDMPHHISDNLEGEAAIEAALLKTL
jgi:hypothetical protein